MSTPSTCSCGRVLYTVDRLKEVVPDQRAFIRAPCAHCDRPCKDGAEKCQACKNLKADQRRSCLVARPGGRGDRVRHRNAGVRPGAPEAPPPGLHGGPVAGVERLARGGGSMTRRRRIVRAFRLGAWSVAKHWLHIKVYGEWVP